MTQMEFETFVADELQGRWPKWQTTRALLEDWYSVLRYYTVEQCTQAVQEHRLSDAAIAFEPKIQDVRRLLRKVDRKASIAAGVPLVPWVLCVEAPAAHPEWQGQEWLRIEHRSTACITSQAHVSEAASRAAWDIQRREGGKWSGVVRPEGQLPPDHERLERQEAAAWVRQHILTGPDGPGRRSLLERQTKGVTMRQGVAQAVKIPQDVAAPPKTVATRADLDRLVPAPAHAEQSDTQFFVDHPVEQDEEGWEQG